tara:strand:- start:95 stop:268 length:174 start_codon:yes stop_codon:yes gene_type:complete
MNEDLRGLLLGIGAYAWFLIPGFLLAAVFGWIDPTLAWVLSGAVILISAWQYLWEAM